MEETNKTCYKPEKKKMAVKFGGGGVGGGFLLVGGALVIASLVSDFALKKRRQKTPPATNNHQHPPNKLEMETEKHEVSKGLHLLVPADSSTSVHHHLSNGMAKGVTNIDSKSLISTQIWILDEKPKLEINGEKLVPNNDDEHIIISNGPKQPENIPLFNDSRINVKEVSENAQKIDVKEEIEVMKEEATAYADLIAVKDLPQKHVCIEEEQGEEDSNDGDAVAKKFEEMVEKAHRDQTAPELQFDEDGETVENVDQEIICPYSSTSQSGSFENHDVKLENVNKNEYTESTVSKEVEGGDQAIEAGQVIEDEEKEAYDHDDDTEVIEETSHVDYNNNDQRVESSEEPDRQNVFSDVVEFSFPVLEGSHPNPEYAEENVSTEIPLSPEAIKVVKVDVAIEADSTTSLIAVDGNTPGKVVGEERNKVDDDDDDDDGRENIEDKGEDPIETVDADMVHKVETEDNHKMRLTEAEEVEKTDESSDGTGDSSVESNSEAIWPEESMQKLSQEIQELKINDQILRERMEGDRTVNTEYHNPYNSKENSNTNANGHGTIEDDGNSATSLSERYMIKLATLPLKWWIWPSPMLVAVWCLSYWYFGLSLVKICLIVVFSIMLFKLQLV